MPGCVYSITLEQPGYADTKTPEKGEVLCCCYVTYYKLLTTIWAFKCVINIIFLFVQCNINPLIAHLLDAGCVIERKMVVCITRYVCLCLSLSPSSPSLLVLFGSICSWRSSFWRPQTPSSAIINTQVARHRTMQPAATTGSDHHLPSSRWGHTQTHTRKHKIHILAFCCFSLSDLCTTYFFLILVPVCPFHIFSVSVAALEDVRLLV